MKEYKLNLPDRLKDKKQEILEYLLVSHYADDVLTAGSCGIILGIEKYDFRYKTLPKYEN